MARFKSGSTVELDLPASCQRLGREVYRLVRNRQFKAAHQAVRRAELADRHGPVDLAAPLDSLGLPRPMIQTLAGACIHTVDDVRDRTDLDLVAIGLSDGQIAELRLLTRPPTKERELSGGRGVYGAASPCGLSAVDGARARR